MPKTAAKLDDFEVLATIGTGSFGTCRKVRRKGDGKVFVWKEIEYGGMTEREKQLLVQEVNLLRELRHAHIVRYHDRIIDRAGSTLYIVMEYCPGGDLAALIAKHRERRSYLSEQFVWRVLEQLLLALQECHRKREGVHKVLHRDLKPANVFLDASENVKLGDFGLARVLHHNFSLAKTFVGTPYYMSPEQLTEQSYDEKSDLWSLGCLVYELCALTPPFTAANQKALSARVREGRHTRIPHCFSSKLSRIISELLQTEPSRRPEIANLLQTIASHGTRPEEPMPRACPSASSLERREEELTQREQVLRMREEELQRREEDLRQREELLKARERQLAAREKAVRQREQALRPKHCHVPLQAMDTNKQH